MTKQPFTLIFLFLFVFCTFISTPCVYADINDELTFIENEIGINSSDHTTIERIIELENQLGIAVAEGSTIIERLNTIEQLLGVDIGTPSNDKSNTSVNAGNIIISTTPGEIEHLPYSTRLNRNFEFSPDQNYVLLYNSDTASIKYVANGNVKVSYYQDEDDESEPLVRLVALQQTQSSLDMQIELGDPKCTIEVYESLGNSSVTLQQPIYSPKNVFGIVFYTVFSDDIFVKEGMTTFGLENNEIYAFISAQPVNAKENYYAEINGVLVFHSEQNADSYTFGDYSYEIKDYYDNSHICMGEMPISRESTYNGLLFVEANSTTGNKVLFVPMIDGNGIVSTRAECTADFIPDYSFNVIGSCPFSLFIDQEYAFNDCYYYEYTLQEVYSLYSLGAELTLGKDGSYLYFDTDPYNLGRDLSSYYLEKVERINKTLGFPESVYARMLLTSALDGIQTAKCDRFSASWTYSPQKGLEIIYEPLL